MSKNSEKELYRALRKRAYDCPVNEFKTLLQKFGDDGRAVEVMQSVVRKNIKICQDSDFNFDSEIDELGKKQKLLDDFYLEQKKSLKNVFDANSLPENKEQELREEISALKERVNKLENGKQKAPKLGG